MASDYDPEILILVSGFFLSAFFIGIFERTRRFGCLIARKLQNCNKMVTKSSKSIRRHIRPCMEFLA